MLRLTSILYSIVASAFAGGAVTAALVMGYVDARAIIVAAVAGAIVALPASYLIAKQLSDT
jgi:hypothetical protein